MTDDDPRTIPRPAREEQALAEVGRTAVRRPTAWLAAAAVLAPLAAVPLADALAGRPLVEAAAALGAGASEARSRLAEAGPRAAHHALEAALERAESALEDGSWVRERLRPPAQWALSALLGVGNEQAYLGRDGWLFYRPDLDLVTGPGFLEPAVLERRERGGDAWEAPPASDPRAAILDFARQLGERDIGLVLMPTPVKPAVHPERFAAGAFPERALDNPSAEAFRREIEAAGIEIVDLGDALRRGALAGEPQFLATDTHWRPAAVDRAAGELARRIEARLGGAPEPGGGSSPALVRRPAVVEGRGDLAALLGLPAGAGLLAVERLEIQIVTSRAGRAWRPDRRAPVLLLGDSFTNVYSDPSLGWGAGAGLAEQLAFHLGRPLDRIARNAGGPAAARRELARAGAGRLAGKRLVVWQFAARELATGDWQPVPLP